MNTFSIWYFLKTTGETFRAYPVYPDSITLDWEQESGQKFFRRKFNGKVKFVGADYDAIMAAPFGQKITFSASAHSPTGDATPGLFTAHFYKADCEINEDAQTVEVSPTIDDGYGPILDGWEKEFNLTKLAPEITPLQMVRRPVIQIYNTGRNTVTCLLSDMAWEQECEAVDDPSAYGFVNMNGIALAMYSVFQKEDFDWGGMTPVPGTFRFNMENIENKSEVKDGYYVKIYPHTGWITICDADDDSIIWQNVPSGESWWFPLEAELFSTDPDLAGKHLIIQGIRVALYARIVCDVMQIDGMDTTALRDDDFVGKLPGYRRYLGYNFGAEGVAFEIKEQMSTTPTEYGLSAGGHYYVKPVYPATSGYGELLPICRSSWDEFSIWWLTNGSPVAGVFEHDGRKAFTLRDAYPLHSVLSVLLAEINAGVTFSNTSAYSKFFYGNDAQAIRDADDTNIFITPKSNLIAVEYDSAAQRGNITLKQVLEMLRDVYRCFWFIDNGKLRIEHAAFFARGGNYVGPMGVGIDLTQLYYTRSGKLVADGQMTYKYDKPETYSRIELSWMDDVTAPFEGAIDIVEDYVLKGKKEEVNIAKFTSDVDYVMISPNDVSKDGFMLLGASLVGGAWKVPLVDFLWPGSVEVKTTLQNGYLAFEWLTRYYLYDLCASDYEIGGVAGVAIGTIPLKTQEVTFPSEGISPGVLGIPNTFQLIKTHIGNGQIRKMSLELLSLQIKATLNYATT